MLKIRLQGTKNDIRWFVRLLQRDKRFELNNVSTFFDNVGTDKYKRVYAEVSRKKTDSDVAVSYAGMIMIPGWFLIGAFVVGVIGFIVLCIFFFKKNPVELQVSGYKGRQLVTKEGYITMAVCLCVTGMLLMI